jgi:hypothetical protein
MKIPRRNIVIGAALVFSLLALCASVSAEDKLKPYLDRTYSVVHEFDTRVGELFFGFFPTFKESLASTMKSVDRVFPFIAGFHWVFYVATFIGILAMLSRLCEISKRYLINSVLGIALLLILIHVLGVELKITLFTLIAAALLGVPGVLLALLLHYTGIVI